MRWTPLHPRQVVTLGLLALMMFLVLMLATAPELGSLDFSLGTDSGQTGPAGAGTMADLGSGEGRQVSVDNPLISPLIELPQR